jgi:uncharacterized protein involved in outer membrane biogenesis
MNWRRAFTRLLALALLVLVVGGYVLYQRWTDPEAVREAVLRELNERFANTEIRLGAARLSLFGGIELSDLELVRQGESEASPFAVFPGITLRHDKEALGKGRLVIRKVELREPALIVVRRADGTWNLQGLLSDRPQDGPMPGIEIQHGNITFVDEKCSGVRLEVTDVQLTVIPSDTGVLQLRGSGRSGLFGPVMVSGTVRRRTGDASLTFSVPQVHVNKDLFAQLGGYLAALEPGTLDVEGQASLEAELNYAPSAERPWTNQVSLQLREGRLQHPRFPLPLENVSASLRWDGVRATLERLEGRSCGGNVLVTGSMQGLSPDADFELKVKAENLQITKAVCEKLPPQMARFGADFSPRGNLALTSDVKQTRGQLVANHVATLNGMSILYADFPYPVDNVTGTLTYNEEGETPELEIKLAGLANRRPVKMTGKVYGPGLRPNVDARPGFHLEITGNNLPIDERLIAALPDAPERVTRQFKPTGLVDVRAELHRQPGNGTAPRMPLESRYVIRFHEATMRYEKFPYPVEDVEGTLELHGGNRWTFTGFKGRHKDGQFTGSAKSIPTPAGDQIEIRVTGVNALLDGEMEAALSGKIRKTYRLFNPAGRVDFTAKVDILGKKPPDLDLRVTARNCAMKPSCFPYLLTNVTGTFHYAKDRVTLAEFRARHGDAVIKLGREGDGGEVLLRPGSGFRADLRQIHAQPLTVDQDFLQAVPPLVRKAFETLRPNRPVRIITDLVIDDPGPGRTVMYEWEGHVAFADTTLQCGFALDHVTGLVACRGNFDGLTLEAAGNVLLDQVVLGSQVFRDVHGEMKLTRQALVFPGLRASVHGGEVYGPIRVDFDPELRYRVDLTASQIDLEKFARETLHRSGQVKGKAGARLELSGRGGDLSTLRGSGSLRIPEAKLYDLPLVLDLLSALSGHLPKGSAFQEGYADFTIEGERLRVSRLELLGDAVSLRGTGEMKVDGSDLQLQMYGLLWGRTLPLLPPLIDKIPPWLSKRLMLIRVEGSLEQAKTKIEPLPDLVEPVKEFLKAMGGRQPMKSSPGRRSP